MGKPSERTFCVKPLVTSEMKISAENSAMDDMVT